MLNSLILFSLRQRVMVLLLATVVLIMAFRAVNRFSVEVLPDLTRPSVTVLSEAFGYAPEEVERLVSVPLENALSGAAGVTCVRSTSDVGLSLIIAEFEWGTDIAKARLAVQERLAVASESLPQGVTPYLTPAASLMGNILLIGLSDPSGRQSPRELRTLADTVVNRRLQAVPGVAEVLSMGGGVAQIQVQPNPLRMHSLGVTLQELQKAASEAVSTSTGGFLSELPQEVMVRNLGMTDVFSEIAQTVVRHSNGFPIRLGDVATVAWDVEAQRGDAGLASRVSSSAKPQRAVIVSLTKVTGFDTLSLTQKLESALEDLRRHLPEGVVITSLYRQADFINLSIHNLQEALRDGALMVAVILLLFLLDLRITFITLMAIPLSLAIAVLVFDLLGLSVNSMTLGGLAVSIGMVVDDAIVDVENIFRRLRENAALAVPLPRNEVIFKASMEVRSSILYATVLIVLVFVPLTALSGVEGRLFTPIALATIISMIASFVVSLTVTNALSSLMLNPKGAVAAREGLASRALKTVFRIVFLRPALACPLAVIALTLILGLWAARLASGMAGNFLPAFREPTAVIATTLPPGTSLKQTCEVADVLLGLLLEIPEIETVGYRAGRAERGDHVVPVSTVEFDLQFASGPGRSREAVMKDIRETLRSVPGTFSAISTPLADRIGHMLSGVSAKIAVKVFGPDLEQLKRLGERATAIARTIPGLEEARAEPLAPLPQLRIEIDRQRAVAHGITPGELNAQLSALIGGVRLSEVHSGPNRFDLVMRLPSEARDRPEDLAELPIITAEGLAVPLKALARLHFATGPNTLIRENGQRRFVVSVNPSGSDLNSLVETLKRRLEQELPMPAGYRLSFEGEYNAQSAAKQTLTVASAAVFGVISLLLWSYFRSLRLVLLVLAILPVSLAGALIMTFMTVNTISIATLVGLIAGGGIAARNNIMLISHYLHLMRQEGEGFTLAMVERGTLERLLPVIMTAVSAGLALVPLLLSPDDPGKEILHPVAVAIFGGLVSSTLLGLVLTPSLFYAFLRKASERSLERLSPASE